MRLNDGSLSLIKAVSANGGSLSLIKVVSATLIPK